VPAAERPRRAREARRVAPKRISPTKLAKPGLPSKHVPRERLNELLTTGSERRVTLVSAHAGTGKTVALASWAGTRRDVAWLTVDRDDNWSPHFWRGIELALDRVDGRRKATSARGGGESPADVGERLAGMRKPIVLVLDDFQEIENPVVLKEVDNLLAHPPPSLHLIIVTRADPRLRLQRLRLAGDLLEIRAAELAFSPDECRELLGDASLGLSDEEVMQLWERTEGWAAGLRLAALSLAREQDRAAFVARFAGDERAVADYLLTEFLRRLPRKRVGFLLRTCVPESLTIDLAAELSGNPAAGSVLHELESENFLVHGLEEHGDVYRFHALLREFLRAQLVARRPRELEVLNRRCARWYWKHGDADLAFRHALAAHDWDLAEEVAAEAWHTVVFGVDARPWDAFGTIPPAALEKRPGLAFRDAAERLALGDRISSEAVCNTAITQLDGLGENKRALLAPVAETFRIGYAQLDGDFDAVREHGLVISELASTGSFQAGRRAGVQEAIAALSVGSAHLASGEFDRAELSLEHSLGRAQEVGIEVVALSCLSDLALLEAARGRLRRAVEYGTEAVEYARRRGWLQLYQLDGARLALAWCYFHWDELPAGKRHLDEVARVASHWGDRVGEIGAAVLRALLLAAEGPDGAARGLRVLRGVRKTERDWEAPVWLAPLLATAEARVLAARGDLEEARAALETRNGGNGGRPADDALLRARLMLASGSAAEALHEIDVTKHMASELEWSRRIEANVLEAVARRELNDRGGAAQAIEEALALAEADSFRRPFVDGGPAVQTLLVEQIRRGTDHRSLVADLIAAFERRAADVSITKAELLEPLSVRERAILRYLPTMMSNAEIASELFVSVNTVKTHLKSIYRKLGAARRREAVERARRLELL
jgi:LuxR family transcriptional regulator, maltose regulon positive regulatory protein